MVCLGSSLDSAELILQRAALAAGHHSGTETIVGFNCVCLFWHQDAKPLEVYSIEFMVDNNQLGFLGEISNAL